MRVEPVPEYERFYDAPGTPFSADAAQKIELESRAAAEMLAAFDETDAMVDSAPVSEPKPESVDEHQSGSVSAVIRHMLEGGELESWCRERGLLPDTIAGEVNEKAMDFMGDVLLENDGSGWQIITDYLVEAAEMAVDGE